MIRRICKKISGTKKIKKHNSSKIEIINPLIIYKVTKGRNCSICWKETNQDIEIIFPFNCAHFICYDCFKKWVAISNKNNKKITCPLCRKNVLTNLYFKNNLKRSIITLKTNTISVWH